MVKPTDKKPKTPPGGVSVVGGRLRPEEGGPLRAPGQWQSPRAPLAEEPAKKKTLIELAIAEIPGLEAAILTPEFNGGTPMQAQLLSAILIAQALDRLSRSVVEAGAIAKYKG